MADVLSGYRTYLLTKSAVTNITSTIYKGYTSQATSMPFLQLVLIPGGTWDHLGGSSAVAQSVIQVDCFQTTADLARTLADAVFGVTHFYSGAMGSVTVQSATVQSYMRSGFEDIGSGSQNHRQFVGFDVQITHAITAPST